MDGLLLVVAVIVAVVVVRNLPRVVMAVLWWRARPWRRSS